MRRDSVGGTILVAAVLCVVCSVIVSVAAVGLRSFKEKNALLDKQRSVLAAAGLLDPKDSGKQVTEKFNNVEKQIVNLETGEVATPEELKEAGILDPATYDPKTARDNPNLNRAVEDFPGFQTTEKYTNVYLIKKDGKLETLVLPIYGKGLWSTMEGFLALESDLVTAKGITFYSHGETPGLGGEVDNPTWKAQWPGKKLRDEQGDVLIEVKKAGGASADSQSQVDGLSGATITTNGVNNFVRFWLSNEGFGTYLEHLQSKEKSDG
ncbi:Na(+)-translocating NADH-quinone reductase subunit C [Bremerella sp. T1]|uniref:Na(+)-translocating NADH-quinone reductase subunit C n=1 Tax=Bremerella sp. TYQ1 TaxID=3119568 RepID=UPI001CCF76CB|nr:Na(+)-translocating NADH-quinone reductase subunit C [Bremerella volcania]UBM33715.1 Na(+)-translocating NADH-quinone reductase subunit C [Bremerella volcania]